MTHRIGQCGGIFATPNGILTSPSYPDNYPSYADCVYTISQPTDTAIVMTFHSMDIEIGFANRVWTCRWDYLEIRDGISAASPLLGKLCGNEIPAPIQSSQNQVWMKWGQSVCNWMKLTLINMFTFRFHSSYRANSKGFQIEYNTLNCGDAPNNACNKGMGPITKVRFI